jgi:hypothetical protein
MTGRDLAMALNETAPFCVAVLDERIGSVAST